MNGKEVEMLMNDDRESGTHQARFDVSKLSSGVYVVQIHAGDHTASQKLVVL